MDQGSLTGEVRGITAEGLVVRLSGSDIRTVAWPDQSRLDVLIRDGSRAAEGALLGLGLGTIAAGIMAGTADTGDLGPGFAFTVGMVLFALPATGLGALIGSSIEDIEWRAVGIPPPHR